MATQQVVNVGTFAGDGTGDSGQVPFQKVNANFAALFAGVNTAWTPVLQIGGVAPAAQVINGAIYTKINTLVVAQFDIQLSTLSGLTGQVSIVGLPVASAPGSSEGVVYIPYYAGLASIYLPGGYVGISTTGITLTKMAAATSVFGIANTDITAALRLLGTAIYMAAT